MVSLLDLYFKVPLSLTWSLSFVVLDLTQGIAVVYTFVLHPYSDFGLVGWGVVLCF